MSLTGDWWTCWQTSRGGIEDIRTQPVHLDQHGELIQGHHVLRNAPRRHQREHPYEVPSVVAVPIIEGGPDYLGWILKQTEQPA